jgi:hypothetical protein
VCVFGYDYLPRFFFAVETALAEQAQQQMQLKESQHIQNKIAEHFGNPIGALSNQIVAHSSQKGLTGIDENSNLAQLNQSEAAASDQMIPADIVVSHSYDNMRTYNWFHYFVYKSHLTVVYCTEWVDESRHGIG